MPIVNHFCPLCDEEIPVDYDKSHDPKYRIKCQCGALYKVDHDADFVGGSWVDMTRLVECP